MKEDFIAASNNAKEAPDFLEGETIEEKALSVTNSISKYQNILILSLSAVLILFAVVVASLPVPFLYTFPLIVFAPFVSRLLYYKTWPLLLICFLCSLLGGAIGEGFLTSGWTSLAMGQMLLMCFGLVSGILLKISIPQKVTVWDKSPYIIYTLIFLGLGCLINSFFCGNPVSYLIAQNKVSAYVTKAYPNSKVNITGIFYAHGGYTAKLSKGDEIFSIDVIRQGYIQDNYNRDRATSYRVSYGKMVEIALRSRIIGEYISVVAGDETLSKALLNNIIGPSDMDLIINFSYSKDEDTYKNPPRVLSQDKFLELSKKVVQVLADLKIAYKDINFQGNGVDIKEMNLFLKDGLIKESITENLYH